MSRRRATNYGLNALTYAVVALMIAPVAWLVIASLQDNGELSQGTADLLHPTFHAYKEMWSTVDFSHYFVNSVVVCTSAALLATAFAASAGYALARMRFRGSTAFGLGVIGTQLVPGSMFLLPLFLGFVWLKQHTPI